MCSLISPTCNGPRCKYASQPDDSEDDDNDATLWKELEKASLEVAPNTLRLVLLNYSF